MRTSLALLGLSLLSSIFGLPNGEDNRLLKLTLDSEPKWYKEAEVSKLIADNVHFLDVTEDANTNSRIASELPKIVSTFQVPDDIRYWDQVRRGIPHLNKDKAKALLTHLSSYHNRYFNTTDGVNSANWIADQARQSTSKLGNGASVRLYQHEWPQPSVIATIPGTDPKLKDEIVVIGAHLDSINRTSRWLGRAPGADDDGTGTVTLLQTLNALANIGFKPKRTLEFQWYAAEEVGLRGSRDIAKAYRQQGKNVVTQAQFDMNGHLVNRQIRIVNDFTDPQLNALFKRLIEAYSEYYWVDGKCGYACSDHAAWNEQGYRSAFPLEDKSSPHIHSETDTVENVNFEHWYQFARVAVGYTVELSEPNNKKY